MGDQSQEVEIDISEKLTEVGSFRQYLHNRCFLSGYTTSIYLSISISGEFGPGVSSPTTLLRRGLCEALPCLLHTGCEGIGRECENRAMSRKNAKDAWREAGSGQR